MEIILLVVIVLWLCCRPSKSTSNNMGGGPLVSRAEYREPPQNYAHCGNCHGSPLLSPCEYCDDTGFVFMDPNAKRIPLRAWLESDKTFDELWKELNK